MEQRGAPKLVGRSSAAQDMDVARRLWEVSEQLTGVRFPLTQRSEVQEPSFSGSQPRQTQP